MLRLLVLILILAAGEARAFEARLVDSSGRPVAGAQVSLAGSSASARTDADGHFVLRPDPVTPATLLVIGTHGELYPPIQLTSLQQSEIRLQRAIYAESVTVSAGATPNVEAPPAAAAAVLGREEQEERKPQHVAEMLERLPGASSRGSGAAAVPVLRGLSGGRTLLLYDDARMVSERRAGASATFIDPFDLATVEVSRGPGSVAYGSDAIGGVIHMRPHDPVEGEEELRYDAWSSFGHGAVTIGPFSGVTASLQAASGYREPTLSDRYFRGISGRGFVTGNPLLEPERSMQLDAAFRIERQRVTAAVYAYHYTIRDLVERYGLGQDFFFRNRGEARIRGVEAEAAVALERGLSAHVGASVSRGEAADPRSPLDDIAPATVHITLRWAGPRGSSYTTLSRYGGDDRAGPLEVPRRGYSAVDLGAGWRLNRALELRVAMRNATNEQRFASPDPASPLASGRSVTIGLNGRWGVGRGE